MSALCWAARFVGSRTIDTIMMSRSRPWKTGGGPTAILRARMSDGDNRRLTSSWICAACAVPSSVTTPMVPPVELFVSEERLDFVDDGLRFGRIDVALPVSAFDKDVNEGRVQALVGLRKPQRTDIALVELTVRKLDDGGHAAKVLLEHDRIASKDYLGQVIDGLVRRHLEPCGWLSGIGCSAP